MLSGSPNTLRKLGSIPDLRALPVEDVDGERDEDGKTGEYGGCVFEMVLATDVGVDWCACQSGLGCRFTGEWSGWFHLRGVAYNAAIPARKSRARPLPPVAEAA